MGKILECSSAGDRRFSAFYACVTVDGVSDTIENHYQKVKRDCNGESVAKGQHVSYCMINGCRYPAETLTAWYRYLWYKYLRMNPELVKFIKQFEGFTDRFRGKSINCQADCVEAYKSRNQAFFECAKVFINNDVEFRDSTTSKESTKQVVVKKPKLVKCPICELNFMLESDECCKVCNPDNKDRLVTTAMEFDEERRAIFMRKNQERKEQMEEFYSIRYNRKRRF